MFLQRLWQEVWNWEIRVEWEVRFVGRGWSFGFAALGGAMLNAL